MQRKYEDTRTTGYKERKMGNKEERFFMKVEVCQSEKWYGE